MGDDTRQVGVRAGSFRSLATATAVAVLGLASAVALLVTTPGAAASEVEDDPSVQEAQEKAEQARQEAEEAERQLREHREILQEAGADLDRAAEAYEHANAHHERLLDERGGSQARVDEATEASEMARTIFADQVAEAYKRAPFELRLSEFVLAADSPASALHRVGLIGRVSAGSVQRLTGAERVATRTADDDRQHEVVTVGTEGAAKQLRLRSDELAMAVQAADHRVSDAEASLESAEAEVTSADAAVETAVEEAERRLREEEMRRLREEEMRRIAAEELEERGHQLPSVDGMVCPIGAPHGFSDSWLAPRPGGRQHKGVDMFAVHGMPLYAVEEGTVRVSNNRLGGLVIHLDADSGDRYYYAHLSAVSVSTGDHVSAGDPIGANGNSGNARTTPPHLHWQVHPGGGSAVNPYPLARALCR